MTNIDIRHVNIDPSLKLHRDSIFGEVSNIPSFHETVCKAPYSSTGTVHAINYLRLGVPVDSPLKPSKRGGARNFASNETNSLSVAHVGNLIAASEHAAVIGLPFNRMITIHWEAAGISPAGIVKATGRYIDLMTKTLMRHGYSTALIWVQESGHRKGGHVHILAHVSACMVKRISGLNRKWLRSITGKPYVKGVIKSDPIGGRLNIENGNHALHLENLDVALRYVLKGANSKAAKKFQLVRLEAGGTCVGKRCGFSQNIGPRARTGTHIGKRR